MGAGAVAKSKPLVMANVAGDTVQYSLYAPTTDKISVTALGTCIDEYVASLLSPTFLWHRDPWNLHVALDQDSPQSGNYLLEGYMRIGDCIDDEWALVWLLKLISLQWPEISIR